MSSFSDIYGYDTIKEHLQASIAMDKVSHAYIINGGLGAGKKLIAKIFAKGKQWNGFNQKRNRREYGR